MVIVGLSLEKKEYLIRFQIIYNSIKNEEQEIIDNIIEELDKKREIAINKKNKALLRDEVSIYRLEENTLDYVLFRIRELTGNKLN